MTHLNYMQFGQQVTVSQGHFVPIQELAVRNFDVFYAVVIDLIGQRRAKILVQLLQGL